PRRRPRQQPVRDADRRVVCRACRGARMNRSESEDGRREIVIVRRGGHDDEEGAHGGVWKIAFADFMTAMMCFFLVMWLVNASNEQTRVALASYFNPIKLVDRET